MDFPRSDRLKEGFELLFEDDFDGTSLDQTKWLPHYFPHWAGLKNSEADCKLVDSCLRLSIDTQNIMPWGDRASSIQTGHFSGPVGSSSGQFQFQPGLKVIEFIPPFRSFTPKYGYFEIRLKAPATAGFHTALWMIGYDGEATGEIRCFELHGANISNEKSRFDTGILPWKDIRLHEECHEDWVAIDATEFHVYGIDWRMDRVDYYVDNNLIRSIKQSPNYEMQFLLGLYERPKEVARMLLKPVYPVFCDIDYFRGYGRRD
jgi:hypothetical protein